MDSVNEINAKYEAAMLLMHEGAKDNVEILNMLQGIRDFLQKMGFDICDNREIRRLKDDYDRLKAAVLTASNHTYSTSHNTHPPLLSPGPYNPPF